MFINVIVEKLALRVDRVDKPGVKYLERFHDLSLVVIVEIVDELGGEKTLVKFGIDVLEGLLDVQFGL